MVKLLIFSRERATPMRSDAPPHLNSTTDPWISLSIRRRDVRVLDDLAPLRDLGGDHLGVGFGLSADGQEAEIHELRADRCIGERFVECSVEALHHLLPRAGGGG